MQEKSKKGTRRKYDAEFKSEVLRMISSGRSAAEVARTLGVGENLIYRWRRNADVSVGATDSSVSDSDLRAENERLKSALRRAEQERDILKKALNIFSRET